MNFEKWSKLLGRGILSAFLGAVAGVLGYITESPFGGDPAGHIVAGAVGALLLSLHLILTGRATLMPGALMGIISAVLIAALISVGSVNDLFGKWICNRWLDTDHLDHYYIGYIATYGLFFLIFRAAIEALYPGPAESEPEDL